MAVKIFLIFVTVFAYVEFLSASPTRRQYIAITEATASDKPVTNDDTAWDDNDEFDLDAGDGWFSQAVVSPSAIPEKAQEFNEYDDDYSHGNVMVEFGGDDDEEDDEEDDEPQEQEAEEDDGGRNESEFLFVPPKDTRLVLEDDDDDQSGPIKVRHTGRSSYPRASSEGVDNSLESSEEDKVDNEQHSYEFTIDEDKEDDLDDEEDDNSRKEEDDEEEEDNSVEVLPRRESHEDEDDEFAAEGGEDTEGDMFDNPEEEEAAQVIYGDHVFLY